MLFLDLVQEAYDPHRHSKKLYAWETGPVDDMSMLLLCGESDFKASHSTSPFMSVVDDHLAS